MDTGLRRHDVGGVAMPDDQAIASEEEIIRDFLRPLAKGCAAALDLKDDAACLTPPPGMDLVITNDTLVGDVHFRSCDEPEDIGFKALAVNVSDLTAKGAVPIAFILSLSLPRDSQKNWCRRLIAGIGEWAEGKLAGGDITSGDHPLMISVTAIGELPSGSMVRRNTAHPGDVVFVTGTVGNSALGLAVLTNAPLLADVHLSPQAREAFISAYHRPAPPVSLAAVIRDHASAAMDISDGVVRDATRMCVGSGVGMEFTAGLIPVSAELRRLSDGHASLMWTALTGGDDYQTLLTVPRERVAAFEAAVKAVGQATVTRIGHVTDAPGELIVRDVDGQPMVFEKTGHDHF